MGWVKGSRTAIGVVAAAIVAVAAVWLLGPGTGGTRVDVAMAELSPVARAGQAAFREHCAECHGENAGGTEKGPPLIHRYYEPSHHGDAAFVLAAKRGVPQHHWNFGNMPAQPEVGDRSIQQIIAFVREVQRANGIH